MSRELTIDAGPTNANLTAGVVIALLYQASSGVITVKIPAGATDANGICCANASAATNLSGNAIVLPVDTYSPIIAVNNSGGRLSAGGNNPVTWNGTYFSADSPWIVSVLSNIGVTVANAVWNFVGTVTTAVQVTYQALIGAGLTPPLSGQFGFSQGDGPVVWAITPIDTTNALDIFVTVKQDLRIFPDSASVLQYQMSKGLVVVDAMAQTGSNQSWGSIVVSNNSSSGTITVTTQTPATALVRPGTYQMDIRKRTNNTTPASVKIGQTEVVVSPSITQTF